MSLQDIPMANSSSKARVLFDNGSEVTLVMNHFAEKNKLSSRKALFSLAVMGSSPTSHNNGKIFTVPLINSSGEKVFMEAFRVDSILVEKVGRDKIVLNKEDFPNIPKAVLDKAAKPISKKFLDILIGNTYLGLQPVCQTGFGCQHCA